MLHSPAVHVPPLGHTTPWHASTQVPALQTVPAAHGVVHERSTHTPDVLSQLIGAEQVIPPHAAQLGRHTPSAHTSPPVHFTFAQRSRHASPTQVCPCGHVTP